MTIKDSAVTIRRDGQQQHGQPCRRSRAAANPRARRQSRCGALTTATFWPGFIRSVRPQLYELPPRHLIPISPQWRTEKKVLR